MFQIKLNQAVSGNEANHIAAQAQRLIDAMKSSPNIDFANDWKMVTLFIGGNDLCRFCFNRAKHAPQQYIDDIQAGLDLLYNEVPRVFVNLVPILEVAMIKGIFGIRFFENLPHSIIYYRK